MSVTIAKADGVTVLTLTSDPQSSCPPLCQILKGLCYSPVCCSVFQQTSRSQKTSHSVLGALHIIVGLLNIGLGSILYNSQTGFLMGIVPFWLGGLLMFFGFMSILSEKYPYLCLITLNVILNLAGAALTFTAIVFYSMNLSDWRRWWCWSQESCSFGYYSSRYDTPKPSPYEDIMMEKCLEGKELNMMLLKSMNAMLIVLSVLELCVIASSIVMGIKALSCMEERDNTSNDDPEHFKALLEEVNSNPTS